MEIQFVDLGAIRAMLSVDGKLLPETFCPECGCIMSPVANSKESNPQFQKYVCTQCSYNLERGQIDAIRLNSKYERY